MARVLFCLLCRMLLRSLPVFRAACAHLHFSALFPARGFRSGLRRLARCKDLDPCAALLGDVLNFIGVILVLADIVVEHQAADCKTNAAGDCSDQKRSDGAGCGNATALHFADVFDVLCVGNY